MVAASGDGSELLLFAFIAIVALVVLISRYRLNPLIAILLVSLGMGMAAGMPPLAVVKSFLDGVGDVLRSVAVVVAFGMMLGKLLAESGGAERIARTLIGAFGERNVPWALMVVGFIVGIPVFFQVGFVLLIPLVFTIARRTGTPLLAVGIPLVASLSIVHGIVPPHPAAMLTVVAFKADVGKTILYAIIVGVPAAILAGPLFGPFIARRIVLPPDNPMAAQLGEAGRQELPAFFPVVATILLPVVLMVLSSWGEINLAKGSVWADGLAILGQPVVALLLAVLLAMWTLGARQGFNREQILGFTNECLAPTSLILVVIGAGGGFNHVLLDSGVGKAIAQFALATQLSPLLLAFLVAAAIRVATGSATVALTTSAGVVAPIAAVAPAHVHPELLVLAAGSGSLILSHVNDAGFWLIKEYFNMTVEQTLKSWTVMETVLSLSAFAFTLVLSTVV